jgi:hypothetical protein
MSKLDDLFALECGAEPSARPTWFPKIELGNDAVPECVLCAGGVAVWRVATTVDPSYARMLTLMGHQFVVSDDSADLDGYVHHHWRCTEGDD